MHVSSFSAPPSLDPNSNSHSNWNWLLQFLFTAFLVALGFLHLLRSTASKYFVVDATFDSSSSSSSFSPSAAMPAAAAFNADMDVCAACGKSASKKCSGCKAVKYCSQPCQSQHWKSEHKAKCKELQSYGRLKSLQHMGGKHNMTIALVPSNGPDNIQKQVDKVLFPYDEFVKLFNREGSIFPPCGLLNCGNSCFANVVLQCLAHTRPLVAYLLEKGHRRDCRRNEWCFLCELQTHMERASRIQQPFSPINILSRLPSIGGNLGYGRQEDAHEFMRFAIDTMQSVCLDEHGGEKVIHPKSQETTLIQHIFGGQLQSQVICTQCNQVSNQYENMMDLTVEIQGDATSLQECLDQFTAKEWLHGENKYKCDGCNDYVSAWKCLTIHQAPNILTIALKRFQSGRFGKINKRISFPEILDLSPYMSEERDGTDKYKLYAVVVHMDMLNASFFGHYICYTKGFQGDWYRIDDCKVTRVELDEVLSQGAYMLLYSRISARPTCLKTFESTIEEDKKMMTTDAEHSCSNCLNDSSKSLKASNFSCSNCLADSSKSLKASNSRCSFVHPASDKNQQLNHTHIAEHGPKVVHEPVNGGLEGFRSLNSESGIPVSAAVLGNGDDASNPLTAGNDHKVLSLPTRTSAQSSSEVPISGSSTTGMNMLSGASYKAPAATIVSGGKNDRTIYANGVLDSKGKLEEHRSEDEPHVVGNVESPAMALFHRTAPCKLSCIGNGSNADFTHQSSERYDVGVGHLGLSKEKPELGPDDIEVDVVKCSESDKCNGVVDPMIID